MDRREALRLCALLLGGSVSAACTRALLSGDSLGAAPARAALDPAELRTVAAAADLIIPATDTPGAVAAGVPEFIHRIVADWYTAEERAIFLDGLRTLDRTAQQRYGLGFASATPAEQTALLAELESAMQHPLRAGGVGSAPFFAKLKELTVLGYYTSEIGVQAELLYRPVPGEYRGAALFDEQGRQWTY